MWRLVLRSPDSEPREIDVRPGVNALGRLSVNEIVIQDPSASRRHAEIILEPTTDSLSISDLNSTNGTFVNHRRITTTAALQSSDVIRIGQVTIQVNRLTTVQGLGGRTFSGTRSFDRELLLESLDQNTMLLYEVARRLNTVMDIEKGLAEVNALIKRSMGADGCEIILKKDFSNLARRGIPTLLTDEAVENKAASIVPDLSSRITGELLLTAGPTRVRAALCVPVIGNEEVLAVIFIYRAGLNIRPFDQRDLQLAVAISHQTALTIQRTELLEQIRREERIHHLLQRFVAPQEAEFLLKDYLQNGQLPRLQERKVTVMFSDIEDSTKLAERLGMQHFAAILENFYNDASEITFKRGGLIRYLGDGVMAIFVESANHPDPEIEAVQTAIELILRGRTTGRLDMERRVVFGASIHTGKAMMGYVGTEERAEFTVLGDTVNVAFRMQEYARPYKVLVGPATMAAIVGKFQTQRIGEVSLKGREKPVQIYEVALDNNPYFFSEGRL